MDWRACFIYQYHKTNNCMLQRSKTQYNVGLSELNELPDFVVLSKICDSGAWLNFTGKQKLLDVLILEAIKLK